MPALRAGPGGTDVVAQGFNGGANGRTAAAILLAGASTRSANQLDAEMLECLGRNCRIAVPGDHDLGGVFGKGQQRRQHELAMPHGKDERVVGGQPARLPPALDLGQMRQPRAGALNQPDMAINRGPRKFVQEIGLVLEISHRLRRAVLVGDLRLCW